MITYLSLDIETDGPIIGLNSMLSLGAAAFSFGYMNGTEPLSTFNINLEPLPQAQPDPKTMSEFWNKFPEAWQVATKDPVDYNLAMQEFNAWVKDLNSPIVTACYPTSFDFPWVRYYLNRFAESDVLGYDCLDIKSLAAGVLKQPFNKVKTSKLPKRWKQWQKDRVQHFALDDAIEQGILLMNILREIETLE